MSYFPISTFSYGNGKQLNGRTSYLSNPLNQYTTITEGLAAFEPQYDLDGNQTLIWTSTGIWHVSYNAENRPICFSNESVVVEMGYDYQGRRFEYKEKVNGAITRSERYLYRNYLQLAALDLLTTTNVIHTIVWDPTEPVATRPLLLQTPTGWFTYSFDQVKNVTELFDNSGVIAATYDYAPFGAVTSATGFAVAVNPLTFSSEIADTILGLIYYNFRPYNPLDGRWINRDPIGERGGGLNLYIFVNNRELAGIDFLGLSFKDWLPFINTTQMIVEGSLKSIPGQNPYDYPGVVRRAGCCLNVEEAEVECQKANQDMYLQYLADANKGSLKTRATDVGMMSFLSGLHPWLASVGVIDGLAGMGGTFGIAVDMASAKKVADAENCNCDKYLIKQGIL